MKNGGNERKKNVQNGKLWAPQRLGGLADWCVCKHKEIIGASQLRTHKSTPRGPSLNLLSSVSHQKEAKKVAKNHKN